MSLKRFAYFDSFYRSIWCFAGVWIALAPFVSQLNRRLDSVGLTWMTRITTDSLKFTENYPKIALSCWILAILAWISVPVYALLRRQGWLRFDDKDEHGTPGAQLTTLLSIVCAVGAFMVVGPSLILLNKHIMQEQHFVYPLTLSSLGLIASVLFSQVAVRTGYAQLRPEAARLLSGWSWLTVAMPIGLCKAVTLSTGNAAYLYLGLGFIQMLKAFQPALTLTAMLAFRVAMPTRAAVMCVAVVVFGTVVVVHGEMKLNVLGIFLMLSSEVCEAINLVMSMKLLQNTKLSIIETLYVISPPSLFFLLSVAAVSEWPLMWRNSDMRIMVDHPFVFALAALLGLGVNYVSFWVIQLTSALTLKILNVIRCIALVVCGAIFYGEVLTPLEVAGYSFALAGFVGYNLAQMYPEPSDRIVRCKSCLGAGEGAAV